MVDDAILKILAFITTKMGWNPIDVKPFVD